MPSNQLGVGTREADRAIRPIATVAAVASGSPHRPAIVQPWARGGVTEYRPTEAETGRRALDAIREALLGRGDRGHDVRGLGALSSSQLLADAADGRKSSRDETRPLTTGGSSHGCTGRVGRAWGPRPAQRERRRGGRVCTSPVYGAVRRASSEGPYGCSRCRTEALSRRVLAASARISPPLRREDSMAHRMPEEGSGIRSRYSPVGSSGRRVRRRAS